MNWASVSRLLFGVAWVSLIVASTIVPLQMMSPRLVNCLLNEAKSFRSKAKGVKSSRYQQIMVSSEMESQLAIPRKSCKLRRSAISSSNRGSDRIYIRWNNKHFTISDRSWFGRPDDERPDFSCERTH